MTTSDVVGIIGGALTAIALLGGALAYGVNMAVNYGQLQQSVQSLTVEIHDIADDLDGLEDYLQDLLDTRGVVTPLVLDRYQEDRGEPGHTHD